MTLLRRAWIQVESKYFSYPTDTQAKEIITIIQSDAAINSWLATSNGNNSIPLILPHVLRAFSPICSASIPDLTAFFTLLFFSPHLLLAGNYLLLHRKK